MGSEVPDLSHPEFALRERVKELTCLYEIARVFARLDGSVEERLQAVVRLLPPAWQHSEQASARITLGDQVVECGDMQRASSRQSADIVVGGAVRGTVEVGYPTGSPPASSQPVFLPEEQNLIENVAGQVALHLEFRRLGEQRLALQNQLRHADRLATLGRLAAGVAHEMNDPLANILGFAQLAQKAGPSPESVERDLEHIVQAALHAREIVRKLLWFAHRSPLQFGPVDLNQIVQDSLALLSRNTSARSTSIHLDLEPGLPMLQADSTQVRQVVVNLLHNALQAIQTSGSLTARTRSEAGEVLLSVRDTGVGMSPDVLAQIFDPFFTTKDVGEGTGLGLSVVHGIVEAHGGRIDVHSEPGRGSLFEVRLPLPHPG